MCVIDWFVLASMYRYAFLESFFTEEENMGVNRIKYCAGDQCLIISPSSDYFVFSQYACDLSRVLM